MFATAVTGMILVVLLLSGGADDHVVVASGLSAAACLGSGGNSGSAGLGSIQYSSAKASKAVPVVATQGTGGQPAPWRPPVMNLQYWGGPVMWKPIRVHFIWYVGELCLFLVTGWINRSRYEIHDARTLHCKVDERLLPKVCVQ
jgi:hypothetical protein